jgi:Tfp pilus assembly protein PilO
MALKLSNRVANVSQAGEDWLMENLFFVFFLAFLAIVYISNAHYSERKIREIHALNQEIRQLRFNYMATKSNLMYKCKQSEIATMTDPLGLHELTLKPKKIVVDKDFKY